MASYPETEGKAGLLLTRRSRRTDTLVSIYRAKEAGIDAGRQLLAPIPYPYAVVCEAHGSVAGATTFNGGKWVMPTPQGFCEGCRYLLAGATSPVPQRAD